MIKKYLLYLLRWQLSTPLLAVVLIWLSGLNVTIATIISNLIGGLIFFWIDRWIFKDKKSATVTHRYIYIQGKAAENMTPDKAMSIIDYYILHLADLDDEEKALGMIKEALRKTIKKSPKRWTNCHTGSFNQCSVCKLHIYHDDKYCRHCGQAIDWMGV